MKKGLGNGKVLDRLPDEVVESTNVNMEWYFPKGEVRLLWHVVGPGSRVFLTTPTTTTVILSLGYC